MVDGLLNLAAKEARNAVESGDGGPFGAVITDMNGNLISTGHNQVLLQNDPTCHAEVVAIREACKKLNTHDLNGCIIYCSCEPCPMCLSAITWANISRVYYGATREDAKNAGFRDDFLYKSFLEGKDPVLKEKKTNDLCIELLKNYKGERY